MKKSKIIIAIFTLAFIHSLNGIAREVNLTDTIQIKGYCIVSVDKKVAKYVQRPKKKDRLKPSTLLIDYETEIFFHTSNKKVDSREELKHTVLLGMNQQDSLFLFTRPSSWINEISSQCFRKVTKYTSSCTSLFPSNFFKVKGSRKLRNKRFGVFYVEATFIVFKKDPCLKKLFEGYNSALNDFKYIVVPINYIDVKELIF